MRCDKKLRIRYCSTPATAIDSDLDQCLRIRPSIARPLIQIKPSGAWDDDFADALRESLHAAFISLAGHCGVPAERRHFVVGLPVPVIQEFIDEFEADVVVMGTVHRAGLERLIGSTTERALYSVPGSVLAVKG
ncbi:Universal stress protein family protein [Pseudomonas sp. NFACC23-1]|nr:Universal stress protein family protein [Pseudomonas sp. NFACC17-2]SEJ76147.1 Universal stress protein family protein [Pseudomonas sp. NFACC23-1]SFW87959.1 Universal stress protein family protein [Pseudomonas sp. NFACC16-2]